MKSFTMTDLETRCKTSSEKIVSRSPRLGQIFTAAVSNRIFAAKMSLSVLLTNLKAWRGETSPSFCLIQSMELSQNDESTGLEMESW